MFIYNVYLRYICHKQSTEVSSHLESDVSVTSVIDLESEGVNSSLSSDLNGTADLSVHDKDASHSELGLDLASQLATMSEIK
ncbi:MAG: hypothetical protein ABWY25_11645 [Paenisporosarcina sp.]